MGRMLAAFLQMKITFFNTEAKRCDVALDPLWAAAIYTSPSHSLSTMVSGGANLGGSSARREADYTVLSGSRSAGEIATERLGRDGDRMLVNDLEAVGVLRRDTHRPCTRRVAISDHRARVRREVFEQR